MSRQILRYEVPVDARWHILEVGPIVHVDTRNPSKVEFWAWNEDVEARYFRVYGTGHPVQDENTRHVGSVITADGALVWHLLELYS